MLKSIRTLITAAVPLAALCCATFYWAAPGTASAAGNKNAKEETYMVVQEGDEYKVIATSSYKDEVKRLNDDYKEKMKEWHDAMKAGEKAEQPKKMIPKKLKVDFETQKGAQKYVDDLIAERDGKDNKPAR